MPRLDEHQKDQVRKFLKGFKKLDFITLSSWLCFSGNYFTNWAGFCPHISYNRVAITPLDKTGYLQDVERVQDDYKNIIKIHQQDPNAFFIFDPPYLQTDTRSYTGKWTLKDFLNIAKSFLTTRSVFFSSEKSEALAGIDFLNKALNLRKKIEVREGGQIFKASRVKDADLLFYKDI